MGERRGRRGGSARPAPLLTLTLTLTLALSGAAAGTAHAEAASTPGAVDVILVGPWSRGERAAIDLAVRKIPRQLRADGPTTIARDAGTCDDASGSPDDDELVDRRGDIHLCAGQAGGDKRDDKVARQVTLALLFAFDRSARWSDDAGWRRLNGWRWSIGGGFHPRSSNLDPAGFAEPLGQRSPRWDLVTFVAALLLDAPDESGGIACRLMSQASFVRARAPGAIGAAHARCDEFDRWADLDHLAGVEVVLAAPSTAMIGSLFGHLFLRLIYRDGDADADASADATASAPPHLSRTVAFLADNDVPFAEDPTYAWKGIVGSYTASLHERPFLDAYREYVVIEGRDLRRWRLNLGAAEQRALLERIWSVAHGTKVAYYFFRRNCATLMVELVDGIRAPGDDPAANSSSAPGLLATPPATTLEPWASALAADGTPLLQFVPEPIVSFDGRARAAARHRIALEPALRAALSPDAAAAAAAMFQAVHAPAPEARAAGYDQFGRLLAQASAGQLDPGQPRALRARGAKAAWPPQPIAGGSEPSEGSELARGAKAAPPPQPIAGGSEPFEGSELARGAKAAPPPQPIAGGSEPFEGSEVVDAWLRDSATIETHLSTLANIEAEAREERERRRQVRDATAAVAARLRRDAAALDAAARAAGRADLGARLTTAVDQVDAFQPAARLAGYRALLALVRDPSVEPALAARLRLLGLLQSELRFDVQRMKSAPGLRDALLFVDADAPIEHQPYLAGYERLLQLPCETRVSAPLRSLQRAKQRLLAVRAVSLSPTTPADAPEAAIATEAVRRNYEASLPHSGIDRFSLLGGVALGAAAPARAGLVLGGALYDEALGDHHRFGFPSDTALVVARSSLFLAVARGAPQVAAYDAHLFGYRSLRLPLPESGNGRWPVGWELFGTLEGDRARALAIAPKVGWGMLAPLLDRDELSDHLLAGLALAYGAYFPTARAAGAGARTTQAISAPLSVELRAGLGPWPQYRSWCAGRVWFEPMAALTEAGARVASEAGARLEAHLALSSGTRIGATAHAPALVIRGQILRTALTFSGASSATEATFGAGFDLR